MKSSWKMLLWSSFLVFLLGAGNMAFSLSAPIKVWHFWDTTKVEQVKKHFARFGEIKEIRMVYYRSDRMYDTPNRALKVNNYCYALIQYENDAQAQAAINALDGTKFGQHILKVRWANRVYNDGKFGSQVKAK